MTHFISTPNDPSEVVQDDRDFGICSQCGDRLKEAGVATDDELFCLDCADKMDAAAENEFDRQKDEGLIEEEK